MSEFSGRDQTGTLNYVSRPHECLIKLDGVLYISGIWDVQQATLPHLALLPGGQAGVHCSVGCLVVGVALIDARAAAVRAHHLAKLHRIATELNLQRSCGTATRIDLRATHILGLQLSGQLQLASALFFLCQAAAFHVSAQECTPLFWVTSAFAPLWGGACNKQPHSRNREMIRLSLQLQHRC